MLRSSLVIPSIPGDLLSFSEKITWRNSGSVKSMSNSLSYKLLLFKAFSSKSLFGCESPKINLKWSCKSSTVSDSAFLCLFLNADFMFFQNWRGCDFANSFMRRPSSSLYFCFAFFLVLLYCVRACTKLRCVSSVLFLLKILRAVLNVNKLAEGYQVSRSFHLIHWTHWIVYHLNHLLQ